MGQSHWADGKCPRGHDITDPDNVAEGLENINGAQVVKRYCRACARERKEAKKKGETLPRAFVPDRYPPRICTYCGKEFRRGTQRISMNNWNRRLYCSPECRQDAIESKSIRPKPLSDAEVERIRKMIGFYEWGKNDKSEATEVGQQELWSTSPQANQGNALPDSRPA